MTRPLRYVPTSALRTIDTMIEWLAPTRLFGARWHIWHEAVLREDEGRGEGGIWGDPWRGVVSGGPVP